MESRLADKLVKIKCPVDPLQNPEGAFTWLAAKMGISGENAAVQLGLAISKDDFVTKMKDNPLRLVEELCDLVCFIAIYNKNFLKYPTFIA